MVRRRQLPDCSMAWRAVICEPDCGCERPVREGAVDSGSLLSGTGRAMGRAELRGDVRGCSESVGPGLSSLACATWFGILAKVERYLFHFLMYDQKSHALL